MADAPKKLETAPAASSEANVQLAALVAAEVAKVLAPPEKGSSKKPPKRPLEDEFKGQRQYIVGPGKCYHNNRLYKAGEVITLTDRRPCRDMVPVTKGTPEPTPAAPAGPRVNDKPVG